MNEIVERVDLAAHNVMICFSTDGERPLRWEVRDNNIADASLPEEQWEPVGTVFVGPDFQEGDKLENPPGSVYWARRDAVAKAVIRAMREPTQAMVDACADAYGDCIHDFDTTWGVCIGTALGERDPIDYAIRTDPKRAMIDAALKD